MIHHVEQVTKDDLFRAICTCGATSGPRFAKAEAHEWEDQHRKLVERARAHLRDRAPSLKDQHHYYRERAADPHETPANRALWQMLADGLASRIGPPEKDQPLEIDVTYTPRHRNGRDHP